MLVWKSYNAIIALFTIQNVEFIGNKQFSTLILDSTKKTLVIYIASLKKTVEITINPL